MSRTTYRGFLLWALVGIISGCSRSSEPPEQGLQHPFVYEERMGLATWHENKGCLAVFNSSVTPGTRVVLVDQPASAEPPVVKEDTVAERLLQACDKGLSGADSNGVTPSFYQVAMANGTAPHGGAVFAILDPPGPVLIRDGHVDADLDGDGTKESFRVCTGAETAHFMAWTGSPAEGRPRWHGTYYIGYDVVPSCTDQDVAGMVALEK